MNRGSLVMFVGMGLLLVFVLSCVFNLLGSTNNLVNSTRTLNENLLHLLHLLHSDATTHIAREEASLVSTTFQLSIKFDSLSTLLTSMHPSASILVASPSPSPRDLINYEDNLIASSSAVSEAPNPQPSTNRLHPG